MNNDGIDLILNLYSRLEFDFLYYSTLYCIQFAQQRFYSINIAVNSNISRVNSINI